MVTPGPKAETTDKNGKLKKIIVNVHMRFSHNAYVNT